METMKWKLPGMLALVLLAACGRQPDTYEDVLKAHLEAYPQMAVSDLYKLCHQASMGNAHLLEMDSLAAYGYLRDELDGLAPSASEPLVEPLTPDGAVVRVNLRPYKQRRLDAAALFRAMVRSARAFPPSEAQLERCWHDALDLSAQGQAPFDRDTLGAFIARQRAEGYPAVHHSNGYTERYRPAYRVVLKQYLPQ